MRYYARYNLLKDFPDLKFSINGGIETYEDMEEHLAQGVHGCMVGRAVINRPWMFSTVDTRLYGEAIELQFHTSYLLLRFASQSITKSVKLLKLLSCAS